MKNPMHFASEACKNWLELRAGMFVHFGVNTFADAEWSMGNLDATIFSPNDFDADQWACAAKSAGLNYILLVTKHVDGFSLWPTQYSDYAVHRSSKPNLDVVGEVAAACARHNIKLGLYYCLWDTHHPCYFLDAAYARLVKHQWTELLTNYGEIVELWVDGGWKKGTVDQPDSRRWHWQELYEHAKSIQPDCMIGFNGTTDRPGEVILWPCDFRIYEKGVPPLNEQLIYAERDELILLPGECDYTMSCDGGKQTGNAHEVFADGKWFWHEDDHTVQEAKWIAETIETCNERYANFVINVGPNSSGQLRAEDIRCLEEVGRYRDQHATV